MWTQLFLEIVRVGKFRDILELIYANHDFQTLLPGNLFCKIEYFIRIAFYLFPIKVDWNLISGVCTDWNLGNKMRKETLRTLDCFLPFCGSGGNSLRTLNRSIWQIRRLLSCAIANFAALFTSELLPQRRGEIIIVLINDVKFWTRSAVSFSRSVKFFSVAIFPNINGVSITLCF